MFELPSREAPISRARLWRDPQPRDAPPAPMRTTPALRPPVTRRDALGGLIQRVVSEKVAVKALEHIMKEHDLAQWYEAQRRQGAPRPRRDRPAPAPAAPHAL
jgi:hypothetical protein